MTIMQPSINWSKSCDKYFNYSGWYHYRTRMPLVCRQLLLNPSMFHELCIPTTSLTATQTPAPNQPTPLRVLVDVDPGLAELVVADLCLLVVDARALEA